MNRNLLVAGGLLLLGGGLAFYYLQQQNGNGFRCSDIATQSECIAAGCYWCAPGYCTSTPCGQQHACVGECMYEGQKDCDIYNNRCICHNGQWELYEPDSPICHSGIDYKWKCLPSVNDIVACVPTMEMVSLECERPYFSYGCQCAPPYTNCDDSHFCDSRVNRCVEKAVSLPISADNSNWENCFWTNNPYCSDCCNAWDKSGHTCDFDLGREYAASSLLGHITYEWTTPVSGVSTNIYGYIEGHGWTYLGHHSGIGEGPHELLISFATQGISKLRFASCSLMWVNSKPKSFYGHLTL